MRLYIPEILQQVADAKPEDRSNVLKKNAGNALLREVLLLNFGPAVFDLPAGKAPYKPSPQPLGLTETNLYAESRRMYLLIKNHPRRPKNLKRIQIENIFIQMLEGIHPSEAEMMMVLKDKELAKTYSGLTEDVVRAAFPDLLPQKQAEIVEIVKRPVGRPRKEVA
jgi:hypothetical protein